MTSLIVNELAYNSIEYRQTFSWTLCDLDVRLFMANPRRLSGRSIYSFGAAWNLLCSQVNHPHRVGIIHARFVHVRRSTRGILTRNECYSIQFSAIASKIARRSLELSLRNNVWSSMRYHSREAKCSRKLRSRFDPGKLMRPEISHSAVLTTHLSVEYVRTVYAPDRLEIAHMHQRVCNPRQCKTTVLLEQLNLYILYCRFF